MGNAVTVTPGAGFTSATAALNFSASDKAGFVTFTTATTIPASPYLLFSIKWGGSWASSYTDAPVIIVFPCAIMSNARTAAQMAGVAALGPFYAVPDANNTKVDIYCTNAPAASTAYDIGYAAIQGP